jgi:hypothetical protein
LREAFHCKESGAIPGSGAGPDSLALRGWLLRVDNSYPQVTGAVSRPFARIAGAETVRSLTGSGPAGAGHVMKPLQGRAI